MVSAENQPLVEEVSLPFFQLKVPSAMELQERMAGSVANVREGAVWRETEN